jgi:hypothetical protein
MPLLGRSSAVSSSRALKLEAHKSVTFFSSVCFKSSLSFVYLANEYGFSLESMLFSDTQSRILSPHCSLRSYENDMLLSLSPHKLDSQKSLSSYIFSLVRSLDHLCTTFIQHNDSPQSQRSDQKIWSHQVHNMNTLPPGTC